MNGEEKVEEKEEERGIKRLPAEDQRHKVTAYLLLVM